MLEHRFFKKLLKSVQLKWKYKYARQRPESSTEGTRSQSVCPLQRYPFPRNLPLRQLRSAHDSRRGELKTPSKTSKGTPYIRMV